LTTGNRIGTDGNGIITLTGLARLITKRNSIITLTDGTRISANVYLFTPYGPCICGWVPVQVIAIIVSIGDHREWVGIGRQWNVIGAIIASGAV
jgi:hypothetical protein